MWVWKSSLLELFIVITDPGNNYQQKLSMVNSQVFTNRILSSKAWVRISDFWDFSQISRVFHHKTLPLVPSQADSWEEECSFYSFMEEGRSDCSRDFHILYHIVFSKDGLTKIYVIPSGALAVRHWHISVKRCQYFVPLKLSQPIAFGGDDAMWPPQLAAGS